MRGDCRRANRWRGTVAVGAVSAAVVGAAEWLCWRASRQYLTPRPRVAVPRAPEADDPEAGDSEASDSEAVVVLGFPARHDGTTHPLQRWRCRIAVRSLDLDRAGVLIFTGGPVKREWPEAEIMAHYARTSLGISSDHIITEIKAESTWQNIEFTTPMIENAARIKIASDPMHAARARRYLLLQRPDLAARLVPAADYRFGEHCWLKVLTAAHELAAIARRKAGAVAVGMLARPGPQ